MTSHSKPGWRRLAQPHGPFYNMRAPGQQEMGGVRGGGSAMARKGPGAARKPALHQHQHHQADPTLFPGRRLDRRQQQSTPSTNSGASGLDHINLASSSHHQHQRGPGSTAGSTAKLSHVSLPAVGNSTHHQHRSEGPHDPWGSERQDSTITPLRRGPAGLGEEDEEEEEEEEEEDRVRVSSVPALPPQSSFAKVSGWQLANFSSASPSQRQHQHKPVLLDTRETLLQSPVSSRSRRSEILTQRGMTQKPWGPSRPGWEQGGNKHGDRYGGLAAGRRGQQQGSGRHHDHHPKSSFALLPEQQQRSQLQSQTQSADQAGGSRHVNPHRRPAVTPAVSPIPPPDPGPRLNKILWALAPDEHANMSEATASQHVAASLQGSCSVAGGDNSTRPARGLHKTVTVTDLEVESDIVCDVPETPRNPHLTQQLLLDHEQPGDWSRDDRIQQWLVDCDQETTSQSLPSHLPDIQYTFRYLKS